MNTELLRQQLETIKAELFEAESLIPWIGERPLLSRPAFDDQCRAVGIEPPASLAEGDPDAEEWLRVNGQKFAWVGAVKNWRRINSLKCKLESFDYATMPNGRFYGNIMYFGAHTGRFSGSGGNLNLQNLPKDEMFGVKMRHLIAPKEDKRLLVVDLSQIEVRTLCWLAKDHETMKEIKESEDIYEAFAIRFGLWSREKGSLRNDPKMRHKVKAMVLGCGYGAGAPKFAMMSGMSEKEAKDAVNLYRSKMKSVKKLWSDYTTDIITSYDTENRFTVDLPSGRTLDYGRLKPVKQNDKIQYVAMMPKNGKRVPVKLWGGLVAENASQALARDIFSHMLCKINDIGNGVELIMHVHDEVVVEVDADKAEWALNEIIQIMSTPPDWIPDIPVSAEGQILTKYEK
jgi:DNA polymerase I-like protein with 3'-5' exonuclease and polymerase domains